METVYIHTSFRVGDGSAIDYRTGPWSSVADAELNIPIEDRYKGLTVQIIEGGETLDYWFKYGVSNGFLIRKEYTKLILPDMVLSGGEVTRDPADAFKVIVSPTSWLISMITFASVADTPLQLAAAHAEWSRFDFVIATTAGLSILTGEPAENFIEPNLPPGAVRVGRIVVTPAGGDIQAPDPVAANLIPVFQPRRNYKKDEPMRVPGVGIYIANANFRATNNFVAGNWTLAASLGSDASFIALSGLPRDNALLASALVQSYSFAVSDEISDITVGASKISFRMPYAFNLLSVRASLNVAPAGSSFIVNIKEAGVTIFSTNLSIDSGELTSTTAAIPAVISDAALADDGLITVDVVQVGSTTAGKGLKISFIGYKL